MCERGAVTPDVSCTTGNQSTTIASHQSTVRLQRGIKLLLGLNHQLLYC